MEQEIMTDEQLDAQLGTGTKQFTKFRTISVDNGTDTMGTGATGNFIEKKYNVATKQTDRISFEEKFTGVILAVKAQVSDKAKYPAWRTAEFDPSNKNEMIDIFPLEGGKFIKNEDGSVKKARMIYQDLKRKKSTPQPGGGSISTYNYFFILYIGVGEEIIKLRFKGTSRGNWINYGKEVSALGAKLYNLNTIFSSYRDSGSGKYAIQFSTETANGVPTGVDSDIVREMRVTIAKSIFKPQTPAIQAPQHAQIEPQEYSVADNSDITDDEIIQEEDLIIDNFIQ